MSAQRKQIALKVHEHIKAELRIKGTSLAQLSRELGLSGASLSSVSLGKHRSKRVEAAIANALGETAPETFPARYKSQEEDMI